MITIRKILQFTFLLYLYSYTILPNYITIKQPGFPGFNLSRLLLLIIVFLFFTYYINYGYVRNQIKQKIKENRFIVNTFMTFIILVFIINTVFNFTIEGTLNYFFRVFNSLFIILILISVSDKKFEKQLLHSLFNLIVFVSIIGLIEFLIKKNVNTFFFTANNINAVHSLYPEQKGFYRISSTFAHTLNLGQFYILTFPIIFYLKEKLKVRFNLFQFLILIFSFAISMLTLSRAIFIVYNLYLLFFLLIFKNRSVLINILRISAIIILGLLLIYLNFGISDVDNFTYNIRDKAISSDENRSLQLELSIPYILAKPYVGYGLNNAAETLNFGTNDGTATIDNYFLSVILETGILTLIFYIVFLIVLLFKTYRFNKIIFITIVGFILDIFTLSNSESHIYFYIIVGLILIDPKQIKIKSQVA